MGKYIQGKYVLKNPGKYSGDKVPTYRSSWEWAFFQFCDNNPAVINWASESIFIPYLNPITGRKTIYIPDALVVYVDKKGQKHAELVEIKPSKETTMEAAGKSARDRAMVVVNHAKWQAASKFCKQHGLTFRIITEKQLFHQGTMPSKKARPPAKRK
jgi:hypothetical protein